MDNSVDTGIDDAVSRAMEILGNDDEPVEQQDSALAALDSPHKGEAGATEELPTDENKEVKPNEEVKPEAEKPIEAPASWRSDEKAIFESLDRNAQEAILRIDQSQQAHFTQRSTELAQARRAADDERQQYQSERARHTAELGRLSQMAAQLLPAKFQDIKSEADYLRLKATDPARASEFEAFQMTLRMADQQQAQLRTAQMNEHLNNEWKALVEKIPNQDAGKAKEYVDAARKTAVDYYGFSPDEVKVVADHRHVLVLQDALAWRQYQANLKAAQSKKTVATPTKVLRPAGNNGSANLADDQKAALRNKARKASNDRERAAILAQTF